MAGDAALRRTDNRFNFEKDIENMAKGTRELTFRRLIDNFELCYCIVF